MSGPGWRSGNSDLDIISQALSDFRAQGNNGDKDGKPFKYLEAWQKLRHCSKWKAVPTVPAARRAGTSRRGGSSRQAGSSRASKRSKTSSSTNPSTPNTPSDARSFFIDDTIDLADDVDVPDDDDDDDDEEEVQELPRPRGRSRNNKGAGSSSTRFNTDPVQINDLVGHLETNANFIGTNIQASNEQQQQLNQTYQLQQMLADYESLKRDGLDEEARLLNERRREKMHEYYGY